jgi:hypothetical protein
MGQAALRRARIPGLIAWGVLVCACGGGSGDGANDAPSANGRLLLRNSALRTPERFDSCDGTRPNDLYLTGVVCTRIYIEWNEEEGWVWRHDPPIEFTFPPTPPGETVFAGELPAEPGVPGLGEEYSINARWSDGTSGSTECVDGAFQLAVWVAPDEDVEVTLIPP